VVDVHPFKKTTEPTNPIRKVIYHFVMSEAGAYTRPLSGLT
jgi:hypothetical protein